MTFPFFFSTTLSTYDDDELVTQAVLPAGSTSTSTDYVSYETFAYDNNGKTKEKGRKEKGTFSVPKNNRECPLVYSFRATNNCGSVVRRP